MAGDDGSEDPRVKPAPGGEEGVYYVEVRPRTLSRPFRPAAPLPSLLSPKRIPGKIALKLLPHLTPRPPPSSLLLLLAERGYRSCGHVEGRGPLPAHRAPRLRLLRRGVQGARQTHGPNRCVEASPRCAPNRRRRAPGPPRGRRPEPPGPPEHHQDLQHLPHPSDIGRAGTRPRHVHAQTGVRRSLRRVRVRHGRGPVRLTRGHVRGGGTIADAPAVQRGEVPARLRGVAQGHQVREHPVRAEQAGRPGGESVRLWPGQGRKVGVAKAASERHVVGRGGRRRYRERRRRGVVLRATREEAT